MTPRPLPTPEEVAAAVAELRSFDFPSPVGHEYADMLEALAARVRELEVGLSFYADPSTYHAIAIFADRPSGDFADDFSMSEEYGRQMPGKKAREVLMPPAPDAP